MAAPLQVLSVTGKDAAAAWLSVTTPAPCSRRVPPSCWMAKTRTRDEDSHLFESEMPGGGSRPWRLRFSGRSQPQAQSKEQSRHSWPRGSKSLGRAGTWQEARLGHWASPWQRSTAPVPRQALLTPRPQPSVAFAVLPSLACFAKSAR